MASQLPASKDFDKLAENRFTVTIEPNLQIGEFREVTGLQAEREILEYGAAGNNDFVYKLPGRVKWPNVVLKRGSTNQTDLLKWFMEVRTSPALRTLTIALVDSLGSPAQTWAFAGAYPVKWVGPNLNAGSDAAATETLEIAHSGMAVH
jgi:phage tail-like protein